MIFVDAQNVTHAAQDFYGQPKQLDPVKLVEFLSEDYNLIRPYWFDSHPQDSYPQGFYHFLRMEGGYRVTSKPLRQRDGGHIEKGVDIELATELIAQGFNDSYEVAILVSGDADYTRAIQYVQDQGKRVVGTNFEQNASGDLKGTVDNFIDLGDHASEIRQD
jgi:uncharacterized LabA/DUF88 family protein